MNEEWTPPSAERMREIEIRRERSNKISQLMGQYMLKGYRMLDKICDVCSNVLLQKPMNLGGEQFCVSCTDLAPQGDASRDLPTQTSTTQIETGTKPVSKAKVKVVQATVNAVKPKIKSETEIVQSKPEENLNQSGSTGWSSVYDSVLEKAVWAGKELKSTNSISASKELLQLIRECTETAALVKNQTE